MITALGYRHLAAFFGALFAIGMVIAGAWHWLCGTTAAAGGLSGALGYLRDSTFAAVLLAFFLGGSRSIDWIWSKMPFLNVLVAPNLNGDFQLETTSNWSIQQAMLKAVEGQPPTENISDIAPFQVTGVLRIRLSLLRLRMTYIPADKQPSRSKSEVLAASIHMERRTNECELHYVYRSTVYSPKAETDSEIYFGAARFAFRVAARKPTSLEGSYWTNRSWQKGINTAGQAKAVRT